MEEAGTGKREKDRRLEKEVVLGSVLRAFEGRSKLCLRSLLLLSHTLHFFLVQIVT
jgi:hypothetical protein